MTDYGFGEKIRNLRKKYNLTQEELALKLNISDKSISKWEMGLSRPSLENLEVIADMFDITLDELIRKNKKQSDKKIKKIVLTGGPCAGKTTAKSWILNCFEKQGYKVLFIPETATNMITGGLKPSLSTSVLEYQRSVFDLQMATEDVFVRMASYLPYDKVLIVCDRGLLDNRAYTLKRDFDYILREKGLTVNKVMDRYDAVFHLVTAAKGAKEFYNLDNMARSETLDEAIYLDDAVLKAWMGHPHLRVIDNSTDFENKMKRLIDEISVIIEEPYTYEIEKKYLIDMPDLSYLDNIPNCVKVKIVQTYLKSNNNEEVRVRQRCLNGNSSYTKTRKIEVNGISRIEIESILSEEEYVNELLNIDQEKGQIVKDRYCLIYNNQYFEIDVYPFWDNKAICEIEISKESQEVALPPYLNVIKEVTNDMEYRNSSLAKKIVNKSLGNIDF